MSTLQFPGATTAPSASPEILRRSRVEAAGVSPWLAGALLDIAFPTNRRDDLGMLAAVTASRCAAAVEECR